MEIMIGGTKAVIAAIPLKECIKIPGIKAGSLFRKNVRQSLGTSNKVNRGIAKTLKKDAKDFFFLHNGVTAICSQINLHDGLLSVKELNVVNGCQSLSTIYNCSEAVRNTDDGYFITKRGEQADPAKYNTNHIVNLTELGKQLIAWHSQRPTISYSETKILLRLLKIAVIMLSNYRIGQVFLIKYYDL